MNTYSLKKLAQILLLSTLSFTAFGAIEFKIQDSERGEMIVIMEPQKSYSKSKNMEILFSHGKIYSVYHDQKKIVSSNYGQYKTVVNMMMKTMQRTSTDQKKRVDKKECQISRVQAPFFKKEAVICEIHYKKLGISKKVFDEFKIAVLETNPSLVQLWNLNQGLVNLETVVFLPSGKKMTSRLISISSVQTTPNMFDRKELIKKYPSYKLVETKS
jgi:hypothetical protein